MAKKKVYLNNGDFYDALKKYYDDKKAGKNPVKSDYIGRCILLICNNLAMRPNFSGYSYIDEMKDDAIVNCISAVDNYNPSDQIYSKVKGTMTGKNPFGYFTFIAWRAFLRRIKAEKKQADIKVKNIKRICDVVDEIDEENLIFKH